MRPTILCCLTSPMHRTIRCSPSYLSFLSFLMHRWLPSFLMLHSSHCCLSLHCFPSCRCFRCFRSIQSCLTLQSIQSLHCFR